MSRSSAGNGDTCPLYPEHGAMFVINGSSPQKQWCSHVLHDLGKQSRSIWPLYGFEESVAAYKARLDKAIRMSTDLPDLTGLEVQDGNEPD